MSSYRWSVMRSTVARRRLPCRAVGVARRVGSTGDAVTVRLYAATGDGIVRLDEAGEAWAAGRSLSGSGAQCLAVDPAAPDTVYAGLRDGGVRRSVDGGVSWADCELPEPGVFSLAVSAADGAVA